jgi:hypothetical protein
VTPGGRLPRLPEAEARLEYPVALTRRQWAMLLDPQHVLLAAELAERALDAVAPGHAVRALVVVDRVAVQLGDRLPNATPQYRQRVALEGVGRAVYRGRAAMVRNAEGTPELVLPAAVAR